VTAPERKAKVLIVDDTPDNIHVLMETLKGDFAIVAAINGEKALSMALAEPRPDLILLDVMMPGIDGYEVCARLKADVRTAPIPVIFITALSDEEDEARGLSLGAVDYITKPFRPGLVKARVRNHLQLKRYRDNLESLVEEQVAEIASSHLATIFALSKLAESRDDDTGKHLERTQTYCRMLAEQLLAQEAHRDTIDGDFVETIFHASPLHDVGKVAIPDAILKKPGKLTDEEFAVMQSHTLRGAETLAAVAGRFPNNAIMNMGVAIARSHHEKWNGRGYPDGLAGTAIPLPARIMAISDVYDALTSKRCYKEAFTHEDSCAILQKDAGSHFDPDLVGAFLAIQDQVDAVRAKLQG
jgi:putative two-component system response regulator